MFYCSAWLMTEELKKRGFSVIELDPSFYFATNGVFSFYGESSKTIVQTSVVNHICRNKNQTKYFLQHNHFPTAAFVVVTPETVQEAARLQFPVVVKPLNQNSGVGVRTGIQTYQELEKYLSTQSFSQLLIEETLLGEDARLLVIQGKFFAAVKRIPAFIVGDGISSIQTLLERENARRQRIIEQDKQNGQLTSNIFPMKQDLEMELTLKRAGRTFNDIPQVNEQVFVRGNANVSTGGVSIDITDEVGDALRDMCADIALAMGANTLGIDVMTNDVSKPLNSQQRSGIVEINHSPMLTLHAFPSQGKSRNPAPQLVDELLVHLKKNSKLPLQQF